jgi:predicted nucleic acid-binding protein
VTPIGVMRNRVLSWKKILDLLIGGAALRHRLAVLTNNRRHFEIIEGIQLPPA